MPNHTAKAVCFDGYKKSIEYRKVLLVFDKPRPGIESNEYQWCLPGGKCCDNFATIKNCCAESARKTILREVSEETGFRAAIITLISKRHVTDPEGLKRFYYFFMIAVYGKIEQKTVKDVITPQWFPVNALPESLPKSHRIAIELCMKRERVFLEKQRSTKPKG